jgi:hypothetical protein
MNNEAKLSTINFLLELVGRFNRHEEQIQQITGERFNVFEILRIGHYEVGTHSPILAELLDPNGRHGQGSRFLELFAEVIGSKLRDRTFMLEKSRTGLGILPDPHTSMVSQEKSLGGLGRVDILICDASGKTLIIENKIYAGDQENQISRYLDDESCPIVIYLTLNGSAPSGYSFDPKNDSSSVRSNRLVCLSYSKDILDWLDACRKEVITVAQVRDSLTQYMQLIKRLTGQNPSEHMTENITSLIIQSRDNLEAYLTILESKQAVQRSLIQKLNDEVSLLTNDGWIRKKEFPTDGSKNSECFFTNPQLTRIGLGVGFGFDSDDYRNFYFGFRAINHEDHTPEIIEAVKNLFNEKYKCGTPTLHWPIWSWWEPRNWGKSEWIEIHTGEFSKKIENTFNTLAAMVRNA